MQSTDTPLKQARRLRAAFAGAYLRDLLRGRPDGVAVAGEDEPEPPSGETALAVEESEQ